MVYISGAAKNRLGKHRFGSLFDADIWAQAIPCAMQRRIVARQ
jgi:hypothetical protein